MVAKSLRDIREEKPIVQQHHHCCGMMMKEEKSLGYPDLDELVKNPQPLEFIIGEMIDWLSAPMTHTGNSSVCGKRMASV